MSDGSQHRLAYIAESPYANTPATPAFITLPDSRTTLALQRQPLQSERIRNDRQITDLRLGPKRVAGGIPFELSFGNYDDFLEALLGGSWTADTPVVGTDQLKAGTTRRSFTVERYFADLASGDPYHRFTGIEIDSMSLSVSPEAIVTGEFTCMGQNLATAPGIIAGATYPVQTLYEPMDAFSGTITEGGGGIAVVTEISLNLANGLSPKYVVGSNSTNQPSIARSNCTGQITAFFESGSLFNKFVNETESSLEFDLQDPAGNVLHFEVPRIKYTGAQTDVSGEGPITMPMPFQALRDAADQTNITIERTAA